MAHKTLLGDLLIQHGLVDRPTIATALRVQVCGNRRLGNILIRMGALTEDQLVEMLAEQLNIEIIVIPEVFSAEVKKKLPRYLCRKYDVIPLRLKTHNIMEVAMADPSDHQAIHDIEHYTSHLVEARLARHSDIAAQTKKFIPYGLHDFFSPQATTRFTRIAVALCLILILAIGSFTYRYVYNVRYGTRSVTEDTVIYKNHDLMLGFNEAGGINLLGRGAFAKGYYSVSFKDPEVLRSFISTRESDFSVKQHEWLAWAIREAEEQGLFESVVAPP